VTRQPDQAQSLHHVSLPSTRVTAIAYGIGFLINFLVVLAALSDHFTMPGPAGWLAIFNVGILSIFMIRVYLWVFSKTLGFRWVARLVLHPFVAWKATWILTIPAFAGPLLMAGYYHSYFKPPVEPWLFGVLFFSPAAFATWVCLVFYLTDVKEGNTPISRAMKRLGLLPSRQEED